jgi:hypothetical protein
MQVTNGTISFERTRKTADYEGKKAQVSLSFNVADGENYEAVCSSVGAAAMSRALIMVGEQPALAYGKDLEARPIPPAPSVEAAPDADTTSTPEPSPVRRRRGRSMTIGAPVVDQDASTQAATHTASTEITDKQLVDAISAKAAHGHGPAISALIVSLTGDPLKKVYVLDQANRAVFLDKLAEIK